MFASPFQPQMSLTGSQLDQQQQQQQHPQHPHQQLLPSFVQDFISRTASQAQVIPTPTVFLSRLAPTCSEGQLSSLGAPFGLVKSARFVPKEGEGKSFGFIMLGSAAQAQACILGLSEKGYKCNFARETLKEKLERLADPFETNLYVKNLPPNYSQEALEHLFIPNVVVSSKMLESHNGGVEGKGVALVRLQTREEAHLMVDKLHGQILPGASAPLVVRFADNSAQKAVREEAARAKKMSPLTDEGTPNSQWGTPQTPGTPAFLSSYGRLPQGFGVNPYLTAQLNFAQQLASTGQSPPPPGMGSPQVAPFVPSAQRQLAYQTMVGQMLNNGGKAHPHPHPHPHPQQQQQQSIQLLQGLPNGASASGAYGVQNVGLGITGPFGKDLMSAGGEEYGLRW